MTDELKEKMKTLQYWFDCAWDAHVVKGYPLGVYKRNTVDAAYACSYRANSSGLKEQGCCAIGAGIPDELYGSDLESKQPHSVLWMIGVHDALAISAIEDQLAELQTLHDLFAMSKAYDEAYENRYETIEDAYKAYAEEHDLKIPGEE